MHNISFKRHRFPPEIIRHSVWLYARFTLSYRDVEDLLAERGLDISYETVRRWFLKFGQPIVRNLRQRRPTPLNVTMPPRAISCPGTKCAIEIERRTDEPQMRERLGKVTEAFATVSNLLTIKADVIGKAKHSLEHQPRVL